MAWIEQDTLRDARTERTKGGASRGGRGTPPGGNGPGEAGKERKREREGPRLLAENEMVAYAYNLSFLGG